MFNNEFLILEFGYCNIKLIVATKENKSIRIKCMNIIPTIEGSMMDGKISNIDQVVGQLSNYLLTNNIRAKKTIITLTSPAMMMREAEVLNHKRYIINSFLKLEAKNYFPVDLSECILDYKIIPDDIHENDFDEEHVHKILMVAIPSDIIQGYVTVAKNLGLRIHAIDIASDCITGIYAKRKLQEESIPQEPSFFESDQDHSCSTAFIDIGATMTNVTIITDGFLKYNKVLNFGVSYLTHAIALHKNQEQTEAEAERIKRDLYTDYSEENPDETGKLLKVIIGDFLENVETFFSFHASRKTGNRIDNMILIGGGAYQKGINEIMEDSFDMKVGAGFAFDSVNFDNKLKDKVDKKLLFYNCIGACTKI